VVGFTGTCSPKKPPKGVQKIICLIIGLIGIVALILMVWSPASGSGWFTIFLDIFKEYPSFIKDIIFGNINNEDISREWYEELVIRNYQINLTILLIAIIVVLIGYFFLRWDFDKCLKIVLKASGIYD
jgi:small-conductance mechanosensitive channel